MVRADILASFPILGERHSTSISPSSVILAVVYFEDSFHQVKGILFYSKFAENFFYHEWMLGFVKCFFYLDDHMTFLFCMLSGFSHVPLFATPWTIAHEAPLVIFQTSILEWVAISSSKGSSWLRDWIGTTYATCIWYR